MADEHDDAGSRQRIRGRPGRAPAHRFRVQWGHRVHAAFVLTSVAFLWVGRRLYPRFWTKVLTMVFHGMAFQGDNGGVRFLLRLGADVNGREEMLGATPLMQAAQAGRAGTVRLLLALGAELDAVNDYGETALVRAVEMRQTVTVCLLLVRVPPKRTGSPTCRPWRWRRGSATWRSSKPSTPAAPRRTPSAVTAASPRRNGPRSTGRRTASPGSSPTGRGGSRGRRRVRGRRALS